ncbi:MAG: type II secretion system protein [Candidatus Paceibacteria bacterium]
MYRFFRKTGFTLVELMVVMSVIGILSSIVYANYSSSRAVSRDEVRKSALKSMQVAIELYKSQYGVYPPQGCGTSPTWAGPGPQPAYGCTADTYVTGLVPDFIAALPTDPLSENTNGLGFLYRSTGTDYKLMVHNSVETKTVTTYEDEFARCPQSYGTANCPAVPMPRVYAVYSPGAVGW